MDTPTSSVSKLTLDDYVKTRLLGRIQSCRKRGGYYRWCYLVTSTLTIICGAVVPVLITLDENGKLAATILSLVVAILTSVEKVYHFREHWRTYDLTKSSLLSELHFFQTRSGPYEGEPDENKAFHKLVNRVEKLIGDERVSTIQMRTDPGSAKDDDE